MAEPFPTQLQHLNMRALKGWLRRGIRTKNRKETKLAFDEIMERIRHLPMKERKRIMPDELYSQARRIIHPKAKAKK